MNTPIHQNRFSGTHWDPDQYSRFSDHRLRPAIELLNRVPLKSPKVIYDLGCGPGNIAEIIAARWPEAKVCGVDNSPEMLEQAKKRTTQIQWLQADATTWVPKDTPDLVYSNAALHWVDDHRTLLPRLVDILAPGGCLAVQMPLSWGEPSHRLMRETLADGGVEGAALGTEDLRRAVARNWVESAETYYDLLVENTQSLDIWETEYLQILEGDNPVLEWVKGTGLRPIFNGLEKAERQIFLDEYSLRLRKAYPTRKDGRTLYPFRRLFIVAVRR